MDLIWKTDLHYFSLHCSSRGLGEGPCAAEKALMSAIGAPSLHSTSTHALLHTYACTSVLFCSSKQFSTLQPSESRCREQLFCLQSLLLRGVPGKQKIQRHIFLLFFRLNEPVAQQVHCILANILHFFYFLEGKGLPPGLGYS